MVLTQSLQDQLVVVLDVSQNPGEVSDTFCELIYVYYGRGILKTKMTRKRRRRRQRMRPGWAIYGSKVIYSQVHLMKLEVVLDLRIIGASKVEIGVEVSYSKSVLCLCVV